MITDATPVQRKIIEDLRASFVKAVAPNGLPNGVDIHVRFAGEPITDKNPAEGTRFPGVTIQTRAPRPNGDWQRVRDVRVKDVDPTDPANTIYKTFRAQRTFWLDFRIAIYAKVQTQFNELVTRLYATWDVGYGQSALVFKDPDNAAVQHTIEMRTRMLAERSKPGDNYFAADYLLTVPVSIVTSKRPDELPIYNVEVLLEQMDDEEGVTESTALATELVLVSDNNQVAAQGEKVEITVALQTELGAPIKDTQIVFALPLGEGHLSVISALTNALGQVTTQWTMGSPGPQQLVAECTGVPNSPLTIDATAS